MLSNTGSRISAFSFPSGPGRKFEKSEKIMRSCLYLFFKKRDRGSEKAENSSYHHTDICAFYLHIISHVYLNEETEDLKYTHKFFFNIYISVSEDIKLYFLLDLLMLLSVWAFDLV